MYIIKRIKEELYNYKLYKLNKKWHKDNPDCFITFKNIFDLSFFSVGKGTYGDIFVLNHNPGPALKIGSFCSIAPEVKFILSSEHNLKTISTYPFKVKFLGDCVSEASSKGDIIIEDDVWIGYGSIIMSGVKIGRGSVIAAGAVVTKDVKPYSIVGGVPAKFIKKRFEDDVCAELAELNFENLTKNNIRDYLQLFYREISDVHDVMWIKEVNKK